jgi:hypothetical protein
VEEIAAFCEYGKKWKTRWHAGLYEAVREELKDHQDVVEIFAVYPLTPGSERTCAIVVKKNPEAVIDKDIARGFKLLNLIEHKIVESTEDSFSVRDFSKVMGYAFTLASLGNPFTDLSDFTATVITANKPIELLDYLRKNGIQVSDDGKGICTLSSKNLMPDIRIIESKLLSEAFRSALLNCSAMQPGGDALPEDCPILFKDSRPADVCNDSLDSTPLLEALNELGFVLKEKLEAEVDRKLQAKKEEARKKQEAELDEFRKELEAEREESRKKTVGKMKAKGVAPDVIADIMGMTLEKVQECFNY